MDPVKQVLQAVLGVASPIPLRVSIASTNGDSFPLPVEVISVLTPSEEWHCPHCRSLIPEKGLYHDGTYWYHRGCKSPIQLPPPDPKVVAWMEEHWGIKVASQGFVIRPKTEGAVRQVDGEAVGDGKGMPLGEGVAGASGPRVVQAAGRPNRNHQQLVHTLSELVAKFKELGLDSALHEGWLAEAKEGKAVDPKFKTWLSYQSNYFGEKDRSYAEYLDSLIKQADAPGSAEGYTIEGTVAPGQSPQVVKPDGTKYQCHISERGKVTCECPAGTYRGTCKHQVLVETKLRTEHPELTPKKKLRKEMTPEEKEAERIPHEDAQALANEVVTAVKPALQKYEFAGSLGRGRATVHDIDIVAVGDPTKTLELAKTELGVEPVMSGEAIVRFTYQGTLVDITFTKEEDFEPTLLYRMGPRDLNLILRARAKRKGWKLNEHGLFDAEGKVLANTQEGIFKTLEMKYLTPAEREKVSLPGYKKADAQQLSLPLSTGEPWEQGLTRPFAFDPNSTPNEGRFRLVPPAAMDKDRYFSRPSTTEGVRYIVGRTWTGKQAVQAIRFNRKIFTEPQAADWWEQNKTRFIFWDQNPEKGPFDQRQKIKGQP